MLFEQFLKELEYNETVTSAYVVPTKTDENGNVLFLLGLRRKDGLIGAIGGKLKDNESVEAAIERKAKLEAGIKLIVNRDTEKLTYVKDGLKIVVFLINTSVQPNDTNRLSNFKYYSASDLKEIKGNLHVSAIPLI